MKGFIATFIDRGTAPDCAPVDDPRSIKLACKGN